MKLLGRPFLAYSLFFYFAIFILFPPHLFGKSCLFRYSIGTEPPTLDPSLATDGTSILIIENLMEGLTRFNRELIPQPAIAGRWKISPDGKRYLFYLRPDVLWSDGKPLTADDFEYAWKRLLNPSTASEYAYFLYDVENAEAYNQGKLQDPRLVGIRAIEPFILEVRLKKPVTYFTSITTFSVTYPLRKDLIEKYGNHWTDPERMAVNGPYRLKEWKHEYKLKLEANPTYYGGRASCENIDIFVINNPTTALTLYETGSLDMAPLPPEAIDYYQKSPEYVSQPLLREYYYGFNTLTPPFNDVRVRKAFFMAIDREELPRILRGGERPAYSWIPPGMPGYEESAGLRFNPEEAARWLTEAGYPEGKNFPKVVLAFNTDTVNALIAENIQAQLKRNLHVSVQLENMEWKVYLKKLQLDTPQLFRLGWGADYPDPDNFMNLFVTGGGNNHTHWGSPVYDQMILKASSERNPKARLALYHEAQKILTEEEVPIMPLFVSVQNFLVKPYVKGLETNPMELLDFKKIKVSR
ncbi:MAG: peptide ABC transporter substrate-binding protein [Nitrospiria bacterium]